MSIKFVLSDWGGVLSAGGTPDELPTKLEGVLNLKRTQLNFLAKPLLAKLKRGTLTLDEFWHELEKSANKTIPYEARDIWAPVETLKPSIELGAFYNKLRKQGYAVGILSNVFPITEQIIRDQGWYEAYDPLFLSSQIGLAKPDKDIYAYVCSSLSTDPSSILFVDDQQRCLDPAADLGMKTVLSVSAGQTIRDICHLLKDH